MGIEVLPPSMKKKFTKAKTKGNNEFKSSR